MTPPPGGGGGVATAPAPARTPRARPAPGRAQPRPAARPPLRVVPPGERSPRARRRRAGLLAAAATLLFVTTLFGVAASHVVLAQNQFRLERLEARAGARQATYERLRKQVAELESPERIVAVAQERLGMVPPAGVVYLPSAGHADADADAGAGTGAAAPEGAATGERGPTTSWSTVKPHLEPTP